MILDENLFQDYRKPLKESAEAVKRILQPRVTKYGIRPFGDNERLPRGFRFRSGSGTSGLVTYNGRDYVYAIKNGEVRVMDSSKAGDNWSETIYKESTNESANGHLQIGPNDVIIHKKTGEKFKILKPQDGQVRVLNMNNKIVSHMSNDYLTSKNFYVESITGSAVDLSKAKDAETKSFSMSSGDYVRLGKDDFDNEELAKQLKSQGYVMHRDTAFASGRDVMYVKGPYNESKSINEGYNGILTDDEEELLWDIANRYVTSYPVSGRWETETQHELEAIADELDVSEEDAKKIMIDYLGFSEEQFNEFESINEAVEEETPWSYKEVEDVLKSLSNNWRDDSGVCKCYYKEEKQHAVKILKQHYKIVETSQDGDWTVIAFETPIQKESMLEDYLRESNYEERAAGLSDRSLYDMIDLMTDMAADYEGESKYTDYLNALKAEKTKREKEAEYKNSRRAKRDALGIEGKYPYYITLYHEYPIYEPAEGGYYYAGLEAHSAEGYNSFKEAARAISQAAEELVDSGYHFVKKSAGEYRDYGDKHIGTGAILCIENNKQFGSRERGYQPYE